MNQVILIAHGHLAHEMKQSAEMIYGKLPDFLSLEFLKEEGLETVQNKINDAMNHESDYLILTDLFCGTPYNASCAIAMNNPTQNIEIVSGMSLPLVLEVASMLQSSELKTIVTHLIRIASQTVQSFKLQTITEEEEF